MHSAHILLYKNTVMEQEMPEALSIEIKDTVSASCVKECTHISASWHAQNTHTRLPPFLVHLTEHVPFYHVSACSEV